MRKALVEHVIAAHQIYASGPDGVWRLFGSLTNVPALLIHSTFYLYYCDLDFNRHTIRT